ncbi:MAG: hypothetical protein Q8R92_12095 [Deltaproteobacteria bacterium]|nr:hypothetical protein [Deltaproteobacteria bacterium]
MIITASSSLAEVAFVVCTALDRAGVTAVLTGGSAATVYAPQAYQSADLDFVVQFRASDSDASSALESLGYRIDGGHYVHDVNPLLLEFPRGPLAIGRDLITAWATLTRNDMLLHITTPTDCCRDRLAGFLFWNDRGALEQALAVAHAKADEVDVDAVLRWCVLEGHAEKFREFERAISSDR